MKTTLLFALLLIGATAPLQSHWYHKWKALEEKALIQTAIARFPFILDSSYATSGITCAFDPESSVRSPDFWPSPSSGR